VSDNNITTSTRPFDSGIIIINIPLINTDMEFSEIITKYFKDLNNA